MIADSVEEKILEIAKRKMMLDTAVQHTLNKETVMKVLRFGSQSLFDKADVHSYAGKYQVDQAQLQNILDRDVQFKDYAA